MSAFTDELVENCGYLSRFRGRLLSDLVIDFGLLISDTFISDLSFD